jgi:hypothetical protein
MTLMPRHGFNSKRRTKRSRGKSPADHGIWFCLKNAYQTQNQLKSNIIIYISRHVFNSKRSTKNVPAANPRQTPAFVLALKRPTKLKIHINQTK